MGRVAVEIDLNLEERRELEALVARGHTAPGFALRAHIVLLAAKGLQNNEICAALDIHPHTVGKWRQRFAQERLHGLYDAPRSGRPREIGYADTIRLTLETTPPEATRWSQQSMAQTQGVHPSTIYRIWRMFGIQPHRVEALRPKASKVKQNT